MAPKCPHLFIVAFHHILRRRMSSLLKVAFGLLLLLLLSLSLFLFSYYIFVNCTTCLLLTQFLQLVLHPL